MAQTWRPDSSSYAQLGVGIEIAPLACGEACGAARASARWRTSDQRGARHGGWGFVSC